MSRAIRDKVNHTDIPVAGLVDSIAFKNEIADMNNICGAKNLLPINATTQTLNGVTFTVNSDGSVTANGTASEDTALPLYHTLSLPSGNYILSGCPEDGGSTSYVLWSRKVIGGTVAEEEAIDSGVGRTFTHINDSNPIYVDIVVYSGYTINKTFYPMIRLASTEDDTYVPYAPINRNCAEKTDLASISETGTTASQAISIGTYFYLNGVLVKAKTDIANGAMFTLNTNYEIVIDGGLNDLVDGFKGRLLASRTGDNVTTTSSILDSLYPILSNLSKFEFARTRLIFGSFILQPMFDNQNGVITYSNTFTFDGSIMITENYLIKPSGSVRLHFEFDTTVSKDDRSSTPLGTSQTMYLIMY